MVRDLYKGEIEVNFEPKAYIEKRYFIVPLRLSQHNESGERKILSYHVDSKLLQKTERIFLNGYKKEQDNVVDWLKKKGVYDDENPDASN